MNLNSFLVMGLLAYGLTVGHAREPSRFQSTKSIDATLLQDPQKSLTKNQPVEARTFDSLVKDVSWSELKMPFQKIPVTNDKHYRVTFFDDFKGMPDTSPDSVHCYQNLKPQCAIWMVDGGTRIPCDQSDLSTLYTFSSPDGSVTPPLRANFKAGLYSLFPNQNYEGLSTPAIRTLYSQTLDEKWRHINKCNWQSFIHLNWMSTDYNGNFSAKMDASQVTVDPAGKGYLILSARKTKILENCVFGGTLTSAKGAEAKCILDHEIQNVISGPLQVYWVDSQFATEGIYYAPINGACPYGGTLGVNCKVYSFGMGRVNPKVQYQIVSHGGVPRVSYLDSSKYACGHSIQYGDQVYYNTVTCPMLNGGVISTPFVDHTGRQGGFKQKNGIFEVKLRIPKGLGAFPAAWMMPVEGGWPYSGGEIDLMEARDEAHEIYQTYHNGKCIHAPTGTEIIQDPDNPAIPIESNKCKTLAGAASVNLYTGHNSQQESLNEFVNRDHVYSVEWEGSRIQWYINNRATNLVEPGIPIVPGQSNQGGFHVSQGFHIEHPTPGLTTPQQIPEALRNIGEHNIPSKAFYWILNHSTWVANQNLPNWTEQHHYIDYVKTYEACSTHHDFCPQGGTFEEGVGCHNNGQIYASQCSPRFPVRKCPNGGSEAGPNCAVHNFARPPLPPGVDFWVDTNPNYPGVYYQKVDGECPYGGSAGVNCQFDGLSPQISPNGGTVVIPGIQYWVDTNPQWPGIYYAKINGACPVGGSIGANCQLKEYPAGFLQPGINYWVDTNPLYPGIYYAKINGACPYGGIAGVNCFVEGFSIPTFYLNPTVNYWVDTDPRWPGIYYAKINGGCPYGGSAGVNCQLKGYPLPTETYVKPGVQYWVDSNPQHPGVYYAKINGGCPFGGTEGVNCHLHGFSSDILELGVQYWVDTDPRWPGVYYAPEFR